MLDKMVNKCGPCLQAACNILSIKEKFSNAFEEQKFDLYFLQHFTYMNKIVHYPEGFF